MIPPRSCRFTHCRLTLVSQDPLSKGLGHVATAPTGAGYAIERLDDILGQQQIRTHGHAHSIAHDLPSGKQRPWGLTLAIQIRTLTIVS